MYINISGSGLSRLQLKKVYMMHTAGYNNIFINIIPSLQNCFIVHFSFQ